tara:strand:- start:287 stop:964 length:678 start_codon:yes stop_codon:yes gene_type:complete
MNPINHVAIIMDGNGRWGVKKKKSRNLGHKEGLKTVEMIIGESIKKKIKFLTLYAFSTENWKRPKIEINFLLNLLETFLKDKLEQLDKNGIKLKIIGDTRKFPRKIRKLLNFSEKKTSDNKKMQLNLALNYGSKDEIIKAVKVISSNKIKVTESSINNYLYTRKIPDPDILIRTGNTNRLSNFLLWQLAYSELFFIKKMWPDFNKKDYSNVILKYQNTKRNFGNI